jgi:hypothetical protein
MMTLEQFEQNIHVSPVTEWDEKNQRQIIGSYKIWYNPTGMEILCFRPPNLPEKMKTIEFYESEEWLKIKPEMIKRCYHFLYEKWL